MRYDLFPVYHPNGFWSTTMGFNDPHVNRLIEQARATTNAKTRVTLYRYRLAGHRIAELEGMVGRWPLRPAEGRGAAG